MNAAHESHMEEDELQPPYGTDMHVADADGDQHFEGEPEHEHMAEPRTSNKRKRAASLKQKQKCLVNLEAYISENMKDPLTEENWRMVRNQASEHDVLHALEDLQVPTWRGITEIITKEKEKLEAANASKRVKRESPSAKAPPRSAEQSDDEVDDVTRASEERNARGRSLRSMKNCILSSLAKQEPLDLHRIATLAASAQILQDEEFSQTETDWTAVLAAIDQKQVELDKEKKKLSLARRKSREQAQAREKDKESDSMSPELLEAYREARNLMDEQYPRDALLKQIMAYCEQKGILQGWMNDACLTDAGWNALRNELDSILRRRLGEEAGAPVVKKGRKKQQPTLDEAPTGDFPELELDEGARTKLDVLRRMRECAWEDAHKADDFSQPILEEIQELEEQHNVLGVNAAKAFEVYMESGPKDLLMLIKNAMDKLENYRSKKKPNAFDIMKKSSKDQTLKPKARSPKPQTPAVMGAKEKEALERQRQLDAERVEKERKAEEKEQQRKEALKKKEEEKEARRLEREAEKKKRDEERERKKEEERKKKEEEKKGPPPKIPDLQLQHSRALPKPCYKLEIDQDLFQDVMMVYHFVYLFAEPLQITRFPFNLWIQAVTAFNETKIIEEVFRQLVAISEDSRQERPRRGGGNWMYEVTALLGETVGLTRENRLARSGASSKKAIIDSDSESDDEDDDDDDEEEEEEMEDKKPKEAEGMNADEVKLKELCERAKELGRYNTYLNYGVVERLLLLRSLIKLAMDTEKISDLIRDNAGEVQALWKEYHQQKRDLQVAEAADIKELTAKGGGDGEEVPEEAEKDGGEAEEKKKPLKDKETLQKEKEERERKRAEVQRIKENGKQKQDELLLKHRKALEVTQTRVFPLGEDRYKRLYWRFPGDPHLWTQRVKNYTLDIPEEKPEEKPKAGDELIDEADHEENEANTELIWGFLRNVDEVLECLDDRGIRESKLKAALEQLKWHDDRCPDRFETPRHHQLRYYANKYKSSSFQKNPLEW